jgi:hypothetical protein
VRSDGWVHLADNARRLVDAASAGGNVEAARQRASDTLELLEPIESYWAFPGRQGFQRLVPADYRYEGADLGILITRGRSMTDDFKLNDRAHAWIKGLKSYYYGKPLQTAQAETAPEAGAFKIL